MIKNVKTHLICGFLGAGKTSAIAHLLSQCPATERWAVLVNEFGEIGLDKALLETQQSNTTSIHIQQVPGGCMCCTAGVPMVVALNQLLTKMKPDRLFIEPTGLGHPKQVLAALQQPEYKGVLDVQGVTTLVDARVLSQPRYREHDIFRQQIEIADLILASKADLYLNQEVADLEVLVSELKLVNSPAIRPLHHAQLPLAWLPLANLKQVKGITQIRSFEPQVGGMAHLIKEGPLSLSAPAATDDFFSLGWQFAETVCFERSCLEKGLAQFNALRVKGVLNTEIGAIKVNQIDNEIHIEVIDKQACSQIEFIFPRQAGDKQTIATDVYSMLTKCCSN
ncbi:CobW family GTP-binding protein [Motilimonas eburnea]|uniref:CobW family GTP-binding protein n=1 Tax=Motilimonas eburnea TaxID=1737488 RepID=UPI001E363CC2|nr:GTP-binding protein [Motilimonas eburnea]MCE2571283.1 GTP-binding protein [Motilimonas eburnea]